MPTIAELLREAAQRRVEVREIPGFGALRFRALNALETFELYLEADDRLSADARRDLQMRRLVAASAVDEQDQLVYASAEDLVAMRFKEIKALYEAATAVNGGKDAEKNFVPPPSSP